MKTSTLFTVMAGGMFAATLGVLAVQAQDHPQVGKDQIQAPAAAPSPLPTPSSADTPPLPDQQPASAHPADDANKAVADITPLTQAENDKALAILQTCADACHGVERFEGKGYDRAGWQQVLDIMGPNADLSAPDTALAMRYLVANLPPPAKP